MIIKDKKKIVIGTAQLSNNYGLGKKKISKEEVDHILKLARKNLVQYIDTAQSYGKSETRLGKLGVKKFNIITKINLNNKLKNEENLKKIITSSLKRLKIKKLHGILIHNPYFLVKNKKLFDYLLLMKKNKLVKKIGFSVYTQKEVDFLIKNFTFDLIQLPLSLFDKRFLQNNTLKKLKKKKIEIHVRSIFLQGLLLQKKFQLQKKFSYFKKYFDHFSYWLKKNNISSLNACLSYVYSIKEVDKIVIGIDSFKSFREILLLKLNKVKKYPEYRFKKQNLLLPFNW